MSTCLPHEVTVGQHPLGSEGGSPGLAHGLLVTRDEELKLELAAAAGGGRFRGEGGDELEPQMVGGALQ